MASVGALDCAQLSRLLVPCPAELHSLLGQVFDVLPHGSHGGFLDAAFTDAEAAEWARSHTRYPKVTALRDTPDPRSVWAAGAFELALVSDGLVRVPALPTALDVVRRGLVRGGHLACLLTQRAERALSARPGAPTLPWRAGFREAGFEVVRQERLHPESGVDSPSWLREHGALFFVAVA